MISRVFVFSLLLVIVVHGEVDDVNTSVFDGAAASAGWARDRLARPDEDVQLSFYVKQTHTKQLEQLLQNVSDPSNPMYGHYLTKAQVDALTAPKPEDIATVQAALRGYPAEVREDGSLIQATVPMSFAQSLLGGDFVYYCREGGTGQGQSCAVRNPTARVPLALSGACDLITPLSEPLPPLFAGPILSGPVLSGLVLSGPPQSGPAPQDFFDSTVESPIPPQGYSDRNTGQQSSATDQGVCCFSIGYGAFMKPCCLRTWRIAAGANCNSSDALVGGVSGYQAGACPVSAGGAAQRIEEDRPQASIDAAIGKTSLSSASAKPLLGTRKPSLSASVPPPHRTNVMPAGCCWAIGFGDLMEPCCLRTWEAVDESRCLSESPYRQLAEAGGNSGFNATGCPETSSEAQSWVIANARGLPPATPTATRPLSAVRGEGVTGTSDGSESPVIQAADEPLSLYGILFKLGALAAVSALTAAVILALRPRNGNRTRPLLQSSPSDTADDAAE